MTSNRSFRPGISILLASVFILLASGCNEKKQIKGKKFLPRDEMVELMVDIHLLDGITNDVSYYRKYNPNDSIDLYGLIFVDHEVERETFELTLKEYTKYPHLLDDLYDEVLMKLNLLKDQLDKEQKVEKENIQEEVQKKVYKEVDPERPKRSRNKPVPKSRGLKISD